MKNTGYLLGICVLLAMLRCTPPKEADEEHGHEEPAGGSVVLSEIQVSNAGIETGAFDTMNVSAYLEATGRFDLPPENIAAITAPMQGTVKEVNHLVGSYVRQGEVLAVLAHPDYIKLQEAYLSVLSRLDLLQAAFRRQKTLDSANVGALKSLEQAKADYLAAKTRKLSLEKQLEYIGINPRKLSGQKITPTISLRAPFSGHITRLNVHKGEFVRPEQELYEMINTDHMHLELNVYGKDILKVKKGQPIRFTVPSLGAEAYKASVFLVGQSFDRESGTVRVHGHIDEDMRQAFMRGLYVEATIFTGNEQVKALPEQAVVLNEGKSYIFIQQGEEGQAASGRKEAEQGYHFLPVEVVTGVRRHGLVEIRSAGNLSPNVAIVQTGAYDLLSEMKKGEGGHHH